MQLAARRAFGTRLLECSYLGNRLGFRAQRSHGFQYFNSQQPQSRPQRVRSQAT